MNEYGRFSVIRNRPCRRLYKGDEVVYYFNGLVGMLNSKLCTMLRARS